MTQLEKTRRDLAYLAILERSAADKAEAERARIADALDRHRRLRGEAGQ